MALRYVTAAQVRARLKSFQDPAILTDDQITAEAERAEDKIDAYLRPTYVLPLVGTIDKYIVNIVLDLSVSTILRIYFSQLPKNSESEKNLDDLAQIALNALKPPKPTIVLNHPLLSTVRRNPDFSLTYLRAYDDDFYSVDAGPAADQSTRDTFFRTDSEFGDNPDVIIDQNEFDSDVRVYDPIIS